MKQHPLSAAFPAMSDTDFDALVGDIKANGQQEAVIVLNGMVLDGWHRFTACKVAKVKCETMPFPGGDPVAFVKSRNFHRRHMNEGQRASVLVALSAWRPHGDQRSAHVRIDAKTTAQMAEEAHVSPRTIENAKAAHTAGLGEAVIDGRVSARAAAEVAKLPPKEREAAVAAIERGEAPPAAPKKPLREEALEKQLAEMRAALAEAADEVQRLSAIKGEGDDPGDLIKNLQAELRAVKQRRDDLMRENHELKTQIRSLERQVKAAKK